MSSKNSWIISLIRKYFQTEKVEYISYIKEISNKAARSAEMSLFCKQTTEAEGTLLQAGLVYRAIRLNIDLFRWNRSVCVGSDVTVSVIRDAI